VASKEQRAGFAQPEVLHALSPERMSTYLQECSGDPVAALHLYTWNVRATGAFWETMGMLEIVLRNALDRRLCVRHERFGRSGTWLDDPAGELHGHARSDITKARRRVQYKGKKLRHGQELAELSFGFWRYLLARQYSSTLWPDLASAFPHAPNRSLRTVEEPVVRLHAFRNRLAHHERIWSEPLTERYEDMLTLLAFIDPVVQQWVKSCSRVPDVLADRP
jgi:hypothetical protein